MKLSYKDKVEIYLLRQRGCSWRILSQKYDINVSNLKYLVRLIDKHGLESVRKGKSKSYPSELKRQIIDNVLLRGKSQIEFP